MVDVVAGEFPLVRQDQLRGERFEMGVSVARWFGDDGPLSPEDVARQYGQFAVSLLSRPATP
jgi:hypothetical protein